VPPALPIFAYVGTLVKIALAVALVPVDNAPLLRVIATYVQLSALLGALASGWRNDALRGLLLFEDSSNVAPHFFECFGLGFGARQLAAALTAVDPARLASLLPAIIAVKARVVAADPAETGERATLNFGHTLGHALEALSQRRTQGDATILHGEAVAYGMAFALQLSRRVSDLSESAAQEMQALLDQCGCLPSASALAGFLGVASLTDPALLPELKRLIGYDKKNLGAGPAASQWVLLAAPGKVSRPNAREWTVSVFDSEIDLAWSNFLRRLA
jgi:hypothetical protein